MPIRTRPLLAVLSLSLAAIATACGSAGPGGAAGTGDVITRAEIEEVPDAATAYDIVRRLRPQFLRSRGTISTRNAGEAGVPGADTQAEAMVYVDGVRRGGPEELRSIPAATVQEIRWLSATDATTRYGTGHGGGVIEVTTRR